MERVEFSALGDSAVLVRFGQVVDARVQQRVAQFMETLEKAPFPGWIECVPGFSNIAVFYDPVVVYNQDQDKQQLPYQSVVSLLKVRLKQLDFVSNHLPRTVEIPVCYDFEFGPDLKEVATFHQIDVEKVIQLHSERDYLVYMVGFAPGFPYLGGMDPRIATPRKDSPRLEIPAGSVGIGGEQTGVYPIESPGGWQLIGRTPKNLFSHDQHPPSLLRAGDRVRFQPIDREKYECLKVSEG